MFAAIVLGGYLGDWRWTGFRGNPLWDWLHLLLLAPLLPTIVVPALKPMATAGLIVVRKPEPPEPDGAAGASDAPPEPDGADASDAPPQPDGAGASSAPPVSPPASEPPAFA